MTGASFRTTRLQDLIRHGATEFCLYAEFVKDGVEQTFALSYDGTKRRLIHNSTPRASFRSLLGVLQGVVLAPDDLGIIKENIFLEYYLVDLLSARVCSLEHV